MTREIADSNKNSNSLGRFYAEPFWTWRRASYIPRYCKSEDGLHARRPHESHIVVQPMAASKPSLELLHHDGRGRASSSPMELFGNVETSLRKVNCARLPAVAPHLRQRDSAQPAHSATLAMVLPASKPRHNTVARVVARPQALRKGRAM